MSIINLSVRSKARLQWEIILASPASASLPNASYTVYLKPRPRPPSLLPVTLSLTNGNVRPGRSANGTPGRGVVLSDINDVMVQFSLLLQVERSCGSGSMKNNPCHQRWAHTGSYFCFRQKHDVRNNLTTFILWRPSKQKSVDTFRKHYFKALQIVVENLLYYFVFSTLIFFDLYILFCLFIYNFNK